MRTNADASIKKTAGARSFMVALLLLSGTVSAVAAQLDLPGPPGSGQFGKEITLLPNGNFVVTDPGYDAPGPVVDVGAVFLYDGVTLSIISMLEGSVAGDRVGNGGVTVLSNGNFVVLSISWNGARGAVTWASGTIGVSGVVSAANSLVGSTANDLVGSTANQGPSRPTNGVIALNNGHYLVKSAFWDNGVAIDAGAVTWGDGVAGVTGVLSASNSLVGSASGDLVGSYQGFGNEGVILLSNGNYVVRSPNWNGGRGAVTWGRGSVGVRGPVTTANSLVGNSSYDPFLGTSPDYVGSGGVIALSNGNYVVSSPDCFFSNIHNGAVTWCSGESGGTGVVSTANSLFGEGIYDFVGGGGVTALANGNYVVRSSMAESGGAVTLCDGRTGTRGSVYAVNALRGSTYYDGSTPVPDRLGSGGILALANGNYLVISPEWNWGQGAVTFGDGRAGVPGGFISPTNSLVGIQGGRFSGHDQVGAGGVQLLADGNYIISSPYWRNDEGQERGAITWGNASTGVTGEVSAANSGIAGAPYPVGSSSNVVVLHNGNWVVTDPGYDAPGPVADAGVARLYDGVTHSLISTLVGAMPGDRVGSGGVTVLATGNYVTRSARWVTWGSGTLGVEGHVSRDNSLENSGTVSALSNGNYVVSGANGVTWGSGAAGVKGAVSSANSLVGFGSGLGEVIPLSSGNYVVRFPSWNNSRGAVTWGSGATGVNGEVSAANSLVGNAPNDRVGGGGVIAWADGSYLVRSPNWDNGTSTNAGAVSLGSSLAGARGAVDDGNGVLGTMESQGASLVSAYDPIHARLLVGHPAGNRVSLFAYPTPLATRLNNRPFTFPNAYQLIPGDLVGGSEYGAYAKALEGASPALALADVATGGLLSTDFSVTTGGGALLLMNNSLGANFELRVTNAVSSPGGRYDVAFYPVVRPGRALSGELTAEDPGSTNRAASVGGGRWRYDDYLLRGATLGDQLAILVENATFAPFIEVRLLSDESVQDYRDGSSYTLTVQGTAQGPRDYLIRVTSSVSGVLGGYTLRVNRVQAAPEIWSFSPESGVPGTIVRVRGTNFLDELNPVVTGVEFGSEPADWDEPVAVDAAHEFETTVPPSAVSGPLSVRTAGATGTSTNAFTVLSPVGDVRREPAGAFSFAISNAEAGIANVVERATNLTSPISWTPVTTNVAGAGAWRYTNATPGAASQQFFRVRRP